MKKIFTLIALFTCGIAAMAQGLLSTPFTAELRDAKGNLIESCDIGFKYTISVIGNSNIVIEREGIAYTDANGIVTIQLGTDGNKTANNKVEDLSSFPFDNLTSDNIVLAMRIDPKGGKDYTISGTSSLSFAVPYAEYSKKSEETNSFGDISLATVNVSIENEAGVSCAVSLLGKKIQSGSKEVKVPAYMPVYLNVACGSYDNVYYEVLINGKHFDNIAGKYWVTNSTVQKTYAKNDTQLYDYFYVRDNFDGPDNGSTFTDGEQTKGYGIATNSKDDIASASDFAPNSGYIYNNTLKPANHFKYENPVYVDSRNSSIVKYGQMTDYVVGYSVSEFSHVSGQYNRDYSPLFVKIPVPVLSVSNSLVDLYKVGQNAEKLNANMVNQIVGPFSGTSNTIVIRVKTGKVENVVY